MYGIASFHIVGRLSRDVEVTTLQSGTLRAALNIAVNTPKKNEDGTYGERTTWVRCALFGKAAQRPMLKQCVKGAIVYITGRILSYNQEIGEKKYAFHNFEPDVVRVLWTSVRSDGAAREQGEPAGGAAPPPPPTGDGWDGDDIPFA